MLLQNIRIWKNEIIKNKLYTIFSIVGLSLSFTILIIFYVYKELNFDKHYTNIPLLYSLNYKLTSNTLFSNRPDQKKKFINKELTNYSIPDISSDKYNKNNFLHMIKTILIPENSTKKIYEKEVEEVSLSQFIKFKNKDKLDIQTELEEFLSNSSSTNKLITKAPSTFFIPIYNNKL